MQVLQVCGRASLQRRPTMTCVVDERQLSFTLLTSYRQHGELTESLGVAIGGYVVHGKVEFRAAWKPEEGRGGAYVTYN